MGCWQSRNKISENQISFMKNDMCILVDNNDKEIGEMLKEECHKMKTLSLHRAFSVFLFDEKSNKMLLTQRAGTKITFPLVWSNSVCSHPLVNFGENKESLNGVQSAAFRKVKQELNFEMDQNKIQIFNPTRFIYKTEIQKDIQWGEYELDYCLLILLKDFSWDSTNFNKDEVESTMWVGKEELYKMLESENYSFSPWFRIIANNFLKTWWKFLEEKKFENLENDKNIHNFIDIKKI